jgi:carbon-monoxide dehydrogenase medium subunit
VVAAFSGADFAAEQGSLPCAWPVTEDIVIPAHPAMAVDEVRYVGEAVAVVVCRDRYAAADAVAAVILALDAVLLAAGPAGAREIPAGEFFVDYLTTALLPGEILTGVRVPKLGPGWGYRYEKFHRTAQAWATVGVAALARRSDGHVAEARIGLTNMGSVPVRAAAAESAVAGAEASVAALRAAAASAADGTQPPADLHGAPDYRRHLAQVLTGRALAAAVGV